MKILFLFTFVFIYLFFNRNREDESLLLIAKEAMSDTRKAVKVLEITDDFQKQYKRNLSPSGLKDILFLIQKNARDIVTFSLNLKTTLVNKKQQKDDTECNNPVGKWACEINSGTKCYLHVNCSLNVNLEKCFVRFKRFLFIGDSFVNRQVLDFMIQLSPFIHAMKKVKEAGRCTLGSYLMDHFTPLFNGQKDPFVGPAEFGLQQPGCIDCSSCNAFKSDGLYKNETISIEYIPIEFTKDRALQTIGLETSQDVLIEYLRKHKDDFHFVYIGQSVHDMFQYRSLSNTSDRDKYIDTYLENLVNLLTRIHNELSSKTMIVYSIAPYFPSSTCNQFKSTHSTKTGTNCRNI